MTKIKLLGLCLLLLAGFSSAQSLQSLYLNINPDTVKAQPFDNGKMWTFDFPPTEYFAKEYNFTPSSDWYDDVRLSSIRFGIGCSSSFISEDGLIITNYHCSNNLVSNVEKEGEDILKNGFYADSLHKERRHPRLSVDQLVAFKDVTADVSEAFNSGSTVDEKNLFKSNKIKELEKNNAEDKSIIKKVVSFYNGGRYALYTYKRYNDIRLVLIPEFQMGMYGGDPDNYTYPRYSLDYTIWRAYENGKPLKVTNYFKFSSEMLNADEPLFVVGFPGKTIKQKTVAQLEYMRDYTYFYNTLIYAETQTIYQELMNEYPSQYNEYSLKFSSSANGTKRYAGVLKGLRNIMYMARKRDFERDFNQRISADENNKKKYAMLWGNIKGTREEMRRISDEKYGYTRNEQGSRLFKIASDLYNYACLLKNGSTTSMDSIKKAIFPPRLDIQVEIKKIRINEKLMKLALGSDNELVKLLFGNKTGDTASKDLYNKLKIRSKEDVDRLIAEGPDAIINLDDPLMEYVRETYDRYNEIVSLEKEITATESVYEEELGQAMYKVYGTSIPPDGTSTLRISDGILKAYEYNGTVAPLWTTFYGLYDRYYSYNNKFPWNLPDRWKNMPGNLNLSTPFTFISTNDIVGGSSGSPVINKKKEFVGIAFDGNIEGNSGYFIYDTEVNRMITLSALGIMESIKSIYKGDRIAEEIKNGKITVIE